MQSWPAWSTLCLVTCTVTIKVWFPCYNAYLKAPFDPFTFRAHPNFDLRLRISQLLWSKLPGLVSVSKIKAHRDIEAIQDDWEKWLAQGNDQTDQVAKQVLREHALDLGRQNVLCSPQAEKRAMSQAFSATQFLHEVSETLFLIRNSHNGANTPLVPVQMPDPSASSCRAYLVDYHTIWDHRWLVLVCHYFSLLQWPMDATQGPPISFMEVLLDLLITFQVTTPLNKKNMKKHMVTVRTSFGHRSVSPTTCRPQKNRHCCRPHFSLSVTVRG